MWVFGGWLHSETEPKYFLGIYERYTHMYICNSYLGFSNKVFLNLVCEMTQINLKIIFSKSVQVLNFKTQKTHRYCGFFFLKFSPKLGPLG